MAIRFFRHNRRWAKIGPVKQFPVTFAGVKYYVSTGVRGEIIARDCQPCDNLQGAIELAKGWVRPNYSAG